jgi:uncharacterized membrane protein (UPF0127 family)
MGQNPHFLRPLLDNPTGLSLYASGRTEPVAHPLETAFDSATRKRGLLGRTSLPAGHALIIAPCNLVHTFRMRFDIDLIFVARDGRIVKLRADLKPGRVSGALTAFATIEMAAGGIERAGLTAGQILTVR